MKLHDLIGRIDRKTSNPNYIMAVKLFREGDEVQCCQTLLAINIELYYERVPIDWEEIRKKAKGVKKWWWDNGKLRAECPYKNEKKHGIHRSWYSNGQIESESTYKDGKEYGVRKEWYESGDLKFIGFHLLPNKN